MPSRTRLQRLRQRRIRPAQHGRESDGNQRRISGSCRREFRRRRTDDIGTGDCRGRSRAVRRPAAGEAVAIAPTGAPDVAASGSRSQSGRGNNGEPQVAGKPGATGAGDEAAVSSAPSQPLPAGEAPAPPADVQRAGALLLGASRLRQPRLTRRRGRAHRSRPLRLSLPRPRAHRAGLASRAAPASQSGAEVAAAAPTAPAEPNPASRWRLPPPAGGADTAGDGRAGCRSAWRACVRAAGEKPAGAPMATPRQSSLPATCRSSARKAAPPPRGPQAPKA